MRFHEYVARLLGYRRTGETGRKEKEKLQPEVAWWMERTEIARVCGRERPRSGIIYGPTRKVRKICTGFAETTLLYATDLNTAQFREPEVDDVYEFFNRVTYFTHCPRRIIPTAYKREKISFFLSPSSVRFRK